MAKNISLSTIKTFKNKFLRNNKNTASRNALIKNDLSNVALNWENFSQINHNFSNLIKKIIRDQKTLLFHHHML